MLPVSHCLLSHLTSSLSNTMNFLFFSYSHWFSLLVCASPVDCKPLMAGTGFLPSGGVCPSATPGVTGVHSTWHTDYLIASTRCLSLPPVFSQTPLTAQYISVKFHVLYYLLFWRRCVGTLKLQVPGSLPNDWGFAHFLDVSKHLRNTGWKTRERSWNQNLRDFLKGEAAALRCSLGDRNPWRSEGHRRWGHRASL